MARYRGPRLKRCRALGVVLPGLTSEATLRRPYPPGQHGGRRRGKMSDYKIRLLEKQKLRYHFGILEKQFKGYVSTAVRQRGPTGVNLVRMLESRLDNIVWRLGITPTIPAARQLVVHGHILVNGRRVDRPSFQVKPGDEVSIKEKSLAKQFVQDFLAQSTTRVRPAFLDFDPAAGKGKMVAPPEAADLGVEANTQAVIEYYSQQL